MGSSLGLPNNNTQGHALIPFHFQIVNKVSSEMGQTDQGTMSCENLKGSA